MSDRDSYLALRSDFKGFLKRFRDIKGVFPPQIKIKIAHSYRVVREITHLFRESGCKWVSLHTAQSAALLHDIGRFPQFSSFGTYDDRVTLNHAALSVVIIDQLAMLSSYNERDRKLIRLAVRLHSTGNLTTELPADEAELTHLLRDADKLDIWKFIIDRDKGSPVDGRFTESNFQLIRNFKRIPYSEAKTMADIRLFRIGWLFDVHFEETVNCILARDYVRQMFAKLPSTPQFLKLRNDIECLLRERVHTRVASGGLTNGMNCCAA